LDSSRLRTGELVAGIGGVALFVFLFFDWFGGGGFTGSLDGWDGLGSDVTGFIVFLTCIAGVSLALLAMMGQRVNFPLPRGAVTAVLATLTIDIIVWRFFANPGDLKIGIFLGLAAAVAIAVGAVMALREDGAEPLVSAPGGRTRASANAPTAEAPAAVAPARSGSSSGTATRKAPAKRSGGRSTAKSGARKSSSSSRSSGSKGSRARKSSSTRKSSPARKSSSSRRK
jgi:hypothetical protein